MTNVEVLLRVESGTIPDGVKVFYERDPEAGKLRAWRVLAFMMGAVTAVAALGTSMGEPGGAAAQHATPTLVWEIALLGLFTGFAALMATPTTLEAEPSARRRVLIVSGDGIITRDPWGLRNFEFREIARVSPCLVDGQAHLCLEDRSGKEHLLDHGSFDGSDRIYELLSQETRRDG